MGDAVLNIAKMDELIEKTKHIITSEQVKDYYAFFAVLVVNEQSISKGSENSKENMFATFGEGL